MRYISYAQQGEDIALDSLFPDEDAGFYVDIGANDPSFCSVTKHFYRRGWSGINVEPVPSLHEKLRHARPRDINLNLGLSDRGGTLTFFVSPAVTGWSTFSPDLAAAYRRRGMVITEQVIPVLTLTELFQTYVSRPVDFLKIDVEGHELEVIRGIDWGACRPRVLVVECAWPEGWTHLIPGSDYHLLYNDGINRYYVRRDHPPFAGFLGLGGKLPPVRRFARPRVGHRFEKALARLASLEERRWRAWRPSRTWVRRGTPSDTPCSAPSTPPRCGAEGGGAMAC
jgi:FkbM family methyltransferase